MKRLCMFLALGAVATAAASSPPPFPVDGKDSVADKTTPWTPGSIMDVLENSKPWPSTAVAAAEPVAAHAVPVTAQSAQAEPSPTAAPRSHAAEQPARDRQDRGAISTNDAQRPARPSAPHAQRLSTRPPWNCPRPDRKRWALCLSVHQLTMSGRPRRHGYRLFSAAHRSHRWPRPSCRSTRACHPR